MSATSLENKAVAQYYGSYDTPSDYKNVSSWGYDADYLSGLGFDLDQKALAKLFRTACGGGCPLRFNEGTPKPGDTYVDLGCGAGHDLVIGSQIVGAQGHVIGVDLTQGMLDKAHVNLESYAQHSNYELKRANFADGKALEGVLDEGVADLVSSNGVFNLTVSKIEAFEAAFRILKPGGVFHLQDVVTYTPDTNNASNPDRISCASTTSSASSTSSPSTDDGWND